MRPFYGIQPVLKGSKINPETGEEEGALCLQTPWPGLASSIYGDPERFKEVYFKDFPGFYFTGDGAVRNKEGYWKITGRMDDVINVTGHRLGTAEVEDAMVSQVTRLCSSRKCSSSYVKGT
jgi:acetyl-CoA synthetase